LEPLIEGAVVPVSQKALVVLTVLATGVLAIGYASRGLWSWVILIIAFGALWLFAQRPGWGWAASLGLIFFVVAAARGIFLDMPTGWLLLGVVATLSAWDLDHFIRRLKQARPVEKALDLERRHLKWLTIIAGVGLVLGGIAIVLEVKLKFGWMLILGMVLILSLSRLIELLGRKGD